MIAALIVMGAILLVVALLGLAWWSEASANRPWDRGLPEVTLDVPVRPVTDAELDAAADDLDGWEAEVYTDTASVAAVDPAPAWPQPLHPRLTDYATGALAPCPLPVRDVVPYDPSRLSPQTYAGLAAGFAADMRDGVHVYDEDTHARQVLDSMYQPRDWIDALPVSPAPVGRVRRALGVNPGTATQRARWEADTGAYPVVRELEAVGA